MTVTIVSVPAAALVDAVYDDAPARLSEFATAWSPSEQWPNGIDPGARMPSDGAIVQIHSQALAPARPSAPPAMNLDFGRELAWKKSLTFACMYSMSQIYVGNTKGTKYVHL